MHVNKKDYDTIVVGAGPNGLAAAITLQQSVFAVLLREGKSPVVVASTVSAATTPQNKL